MWVETYIELKSNQIDHDKDYANCCSDISRLFPQVRSNHQFSVQEIISKRDMVSSNVWGI